MPRKTARVEATEERHDGGASRGRGARALRCPQARRGAPRADQLSLVPLPCPRRPRGRGRRIRRARPGPPGARGAVPRADHAGQPDPARGRDTGGRALRAHQAPRPDALARQRFQLGGARGVGQAGRAPDRIERSVHVRAEDRRARRRGELRERQAHARGDPR